MVEDQIYGRSPVADVEEKYLAVGDTSSANRHWHHSLKYHVVLGADVPSRVLIGPAKGKPGTIYVQDTVFGFAYFGEGAKVNP